MGTATFRVTNIPSRAAATRQSLPFAVVEGRDIVLRSPLAEEVPLNDHLVWMWEIIQSKRRYLKSLQAEGARLTVEALGFRSSVEIRPNGAEMLHLLGASLEIKIG